MSDTRKSPDMSKKKSILKKGDSLHKEETEKLIPDQLECRNAPDNSEEVNVACLQSNGTASPISCAPTSSGGLFSASSSSSKQPLKAIGPKTGTKPPAQPIKFVGIRNKTGVVLKKPPSVVVQDDPVEPERKLTYQGTGSFDLEESALCCTNKTCAYNRVAQSYFSAAVVCLCGNQMTDSSVTAGDNPTCEVPRSGGEERNGSPSPTEETKLLGEEEHHVPKVVSRQSSKESAVPT